MNLKILNEMPPWDWPKDTRNRLLEVLANPGADAEDRQIAASLAGDMTVIDDEVADALLRLVRNSAEPEPVRAAAAIALGPVLDQADTYGFDDPDDIIITKPMFRKIQEALRTLYADTAAPRDVRRRALEASVRAPAKWHADAIRAAYASGEKEWVLTAVFAMQFIKGFNKLILEALQSSDPLIQAEAADAAGNWGIDAAWPHITAIIADAGAPKPLLLSALNAAPGIRPAQARTLLADFADSDDPEIAEVVADAIGMVDTALYGDIDFEDDDDEVDETGMSGGWVN